MLLIALASCLLAAPADDLTALLKTAPWSDTAPFAAVLASPLATAPLSKQDAAAASTLLWTWHADHLREARHREWTDKSISLAPLTMKFDFKTFGAAPTAGRSLFISMHGGGSTAPEVNESQWKNQIRLYTPAEGIYLAPRAPTDAWNMWHQSHIDAFFQRIIEDAVLLEGVNPDRVYLMGYSAGGDGVYQLAPRMADSLAAASMMAGHPNDAQPDGLLNLPFAIHVGANDSAFNRNTVAAAWGKSLDELSLANPGFYEHTLEVHAGKGHWMDREDASAVPWMAKHTRNPLPARIVWKQDDVTHTRFYWVMNAAPLQGELLDITHDKNSFTVNPRSTVANFTLLLNDDLVDLDQPLSIKQAGDTQQREIPAPVRTIRSICESLTQRTDPRHIFTATLAVLPAPAHP